MSALAQLMDSNMSFVPAKSITICSIFPMPQTVIRGKYNKRWTIPAGSKQNPSYIAVEDCFESVYLGQDFGNRNSRVLAEQVAFDIVNECTLAVGNANAQEDAYPGIFMCAGATATPEEMEIHDAKQFRYLRRVVEAARKLERANPSQRDRIWDLHHLAAGVLGIVGESWQQEIKRDAMIKCPQCRQYIESDTRKCPKCLEWVKAEYAPEYAALERATAPPPPITPPLKPQASK